MNWQNVLLIARQFFKWKFLNKSTLVLLLFFVVLQGYVAFDRWQSYEEQNHIRIHHQELDRKSWENNPDKHPHRMAHFGSFAFRLQHPLNIFEAGLESYMGNSVFLEAHKQNTAIFSEANLSTGAVRFGDISVALLIYLILPLIIFFLGYDAIAKEREDSLLKLMVIQGAHIKEIFLGKTLGLFTGGILFFIPTFIIMLAIVMLDNADLNQQTMIRVVLLTLVYLIFLLSISGFTVFISGISKSSKSALITLLSFWLLFFIIIPKTTQVLGGYIFPNPSKIQFKKEVNADVKKIGDSHNPDDPYFNRLKDSILVANNVTSVDDLPFNYSGYIMGVGEKLTTEIFKKHDEKLRHTYQKQNQFSNAFALINPYISIKEISTKLSGTDLDTYDDFLSQAESYRYSLAQKMNNLQMELISSKVKTSEGKVNVISNKYWKEAPRFKYAYLNLSSSINKLIYPIIGLLIWLFFGLFSGIIFAHKIKIQ